MADSWENVVVTRDFDLAGAGSGATTVKGRLVATGATTHFAVASLALAGALASGCTPPLLDVRDGAQTSAGPDLVVALTTEGSPCILFADGFESGSLTAWSGHS